MDPYKLLMNDHRSVEHLFERLAKTRDQDAELREELFDSLREELEIHTTIEEQLFYPEMRKHAATKELVGDALKEHSEVKEMLRKLDKLPVAEEAWLGKVDELKRMVQHHVSDEEDKMFPAAQREVPEQRAQELGRQLHEMKEKATA